MAFRVDRGSDAPGQAGLVYQDISPGEVITAVGNPTRREGAHLLLVRKITRADGSRFLGINTAVPPQGPSRSEDLQATRTPTYHRKTRTLTCPHH